MPAATCRAVPDITQQAGSERAPHRRTHGGKQVTPQRVRFAVASGAQALQCPFAAARFAQILRGCRLRRRAAASLRAGPHTFERKAAQGGYTAQEEALAQQHLAPICAAAQNGHDDACSTC